MRSLYVLDTSVIIKWFRQEEVLAKRALALREAYLAGRIEITVPSLLAYELANLLRYKKELELPDVRKAVQSLYDMGLEWVGPSEPAMARAVEIAFEWNTTVYDAVFAALAESLNSAFVTADRTLAGRLKGLPFVRHLGKV